MKRSMFVSATVLAVVWRVATSGLDAQNQPSDSPKFEVASVKQNRSGTNMVTVGGGGGGRYNATNTPLRLLIRSSYQLQDYQIVGGPDWIGTDRFDIVARAEGELPPPVPGQPNPIQLMVRALLAERFKLVVHRETREMPIFALVVARDDKRLGAQIKESTVDCAAEAAARRGGPPPLPPAPGAARGPMTAPRCGAMMGPGTLMAGSTPISQLATSLSNSVGRMVVDKTGLTGRYDIDLKWTPDGMTGGGLGLPPGAPGPPPIDSNGPSIFAAVQEQLGLKLEAQRGPVEVLVIDSVEHPTEN